MKPACFRVNFIETLQELTWISTSEDDAGDVLWSVEYLSRRPQWFHFQGYRRSGIAAACGRQFDARTGAASDVDPNMLTFALLGFLDNRAITGYVGPHTTSARIAQRMLHAGICVPEVAKVTLEREILGDCGTRTQARTNVAFVGLLLPLDVDDVGSGLGLAGTSDQASLHWYRGRTSIVPGELTAPVEWRTV